MTHHEHHGLSWNAKQAVIALLLLLLVRGGHVSLRPVAEIVDFAQWGKDGPGQTVGFSTRQSLPLPVRQEDGVNLEFVYCDARFLQQGSNLFAPSFLATIDAATGKLETLRRLAPSELLGGQVPGQDIGPLTMPKAFVRGDTFEARVVAVSAYRAAEAQMYTDYDVVLPFFATGTLQVPPYVPPAARELRQLFGLIAETPLVPYYQEIGKDFFAWLAAVAK